MSQWINSRVLAVLVAATGMANLITLVAAESLGRSAAAIVAASLTAFVQAVVLLCTAAGLVFLLSRGQGKGSQYGLATLLATVSVVAVYCGLGTAWGWPQAWVTLSLVLVFLTPGFSVRYGAETDALWQAMLRAGLAATLQANFCLVVYFTTFGVKDYLLGVFGPADSWQGLFTSLWGVAIFSALGVLTMAPLILLWVIAGVSGMLAFRARQSSEPWIKTPPAEHQATERDSESTLDTKVGGGDAR